MNRDDIIRMAREAEFPVFDAKVTATNSLDQVIAETVTNHYHEGAIRFANLVAAAEREACAKLAVEESAEWHICSQSHDTANMIAAAIRARREQ